MKLTLQLQLLPTIDQKADLLTTMERFNEAASFAAQVGFEAGVHGQVSIHRLAYREIRERFGLSSQMAVRAIAKAVEAFASLKAKGELTCPVFQPHGAICYDQRVLSFKGLTEVSLWAISGRLRIPFVCGEYQKARQGRIKGQADLIYRGGKFYLLCTIDLPEEPPIEIHDVIGVDLGVVNLATTSEGENFSGGTVERVRQRYRKHRADLNHCGTKSARRRLCKIRKRESNFRRDTNHVIAKQLVARAKATGSALAMEDLQNVVGDGKRFHKAQRNRLKGWAFHQLRMFVVYKAALAGVPVILIDPAYTSQTCSACGHCHKGNRRNRNDFECCQCHFTSCADRNAAKNIRARGLTASVRRPNVGVDDAGVKPGRDCLQAHTL